MTQQDIENFTKEYWKALEASRTVMLGSLSSNPSPARPVTAHIDEDIKDGSIYFFASRVEGIGKKVLEGVTQASSAFQSKGNDLLASAIGPIDAAKDRAIIDKLWSPLVATYYEQGKSDPHLLPLRFTPPPFEVWRSTATELVKAVAYKLLGKDTDQANQQDRATILA